MKAWPIILIFLIIGGFIIIRANQIDLADGSGRAEFLFKFTRWLSHLGGNMKDLAGNAVKMDWLPEKSLNQTNTTK